MKTLSIRTVILLVLAALLLSACNFPGSVSQQDQVATMAAEMLNASVATLTAEAAAVADEPTSTPFPSATPLPTEVPPSLTPSPTITLTPTHPPEDPRLTLGEPDWVEPFDASTYWFTYDGSTSRAEIRDGAFYYTKFEADFVADWTTASPRLRNFYLEVKATNPAACSGRDFYGLFFRGPEPTRGYLLAFSCSGEYQLSYWDGEAFYYVINWAESAVINQGPGATNRVGIRAVDGTLEVYANGAKVNGFADSTFDSGLFGLIVGAAETNDFTVTFDDAAYWILP